MEKHNHKPNYGRYVEGCPRCVERYPDGPPQKVAKVKESSAMSELVQLLLRKEEATLRLQEEERQKKADELARRESAKAQLRADIERDAQNHLAIQMQCPHTYPNGQSARTEGQVYNDGFMRPFCQVCQFRFAMRRATKEEQPTVVMA